MYYDWKILIDEFKMFCSQSWQDSVAFPRFLFRYDGIRELMECTWRLDWRPPMLSKGKAISSSLDGSRCSGTIAISSHKIVLLSDRAWTVQIPSSQIHHRQMTHRSLIRETPSAPEAMRSVLPVVQETTWRLKRLCSFEFLYFYSIDSKGISSVL